MHTDTAIAAAFRRAGGLSPADAALRVALSKFEASGGTVSGAMSALLECFGTRAVVEGAATVLRRHQIELLSEGQGAVADKASEPAPSSRQPQGGEGQTSVASNGLVLRAPPPSQAREEAKGSAPPGQSRSAPREPTAAQRAAVIAARQSSAATVLTVFDTWRLRDGRAIGDVTFGELEGLRFENAREASLIRQIQRTVANAPPEARVREIVKIEELQRYIQRASEVADAA